MHDLDHAPSEDVAQAPSIDEVRARLAERGLLATRPRVLVPKEPRPEGEATPLTTFAPALPDDDEAHWAEAEADAWDVEPGSEEVTVRCPQCREVFFRPLESTRFACPTCDRAWRFAICSECDVVAMTIERQESWRCGSCNHVTRSWWRAPTAHRLAFDVVARRKHQAVEEQRRLVREGMRKRRWKLIAFAVWSAILAIGIVVGFRMAQPSAASGTDVTCTHFNRLRSDIASGTMTASQLKNELQALQVEADDAHADVQKAVLDLTAAGAPGTSSFLIARTAVADACTLHDK